MRRVEDAFASLPERYLGADPGFEASYRIELEDLGTSWAVELDPEQLQGRGLARAAPPTSSSAPTRPPGSRSARASSPGLDAFRSRRLWARGNLDLAIAFEGFFRLPNGRPPLLHIHEVRGRQGDDLDPDRRRRRRARWS